MNIFAISRFKLEKLSRMIDVLKNTLAIRMLELMQNLVLLDCYLADSKRIPFLSRCCTWSIGVFGPRTWRFLMSRNEFETYPTPNVSSKWNFPSKSISRKLSVSKPHIRLGFHAITVPGSSSDQQHVRLRTLMLL